MRPPMAKILVHSEGLGAPSPDLVRQRAQELAIINGRQEYTDEDWRQAKLELHGHNGADGALSGEMAMASFVSEQDMVSSDVGHRLERVGMEDERSMVEELIAEGMEEAEHERMLEACRGDREEEEESEQG